MKQGNAGVAGHDHGQMLRDEHLSTLWPHYVNLLLGLWLVTSPFAFGYLGGLLALVIMLLFFAEGADTGLTLLGTPPLFGLDPEAREGTRFVGPLDSNASSVFESTTRRFW